MTNAYYNRTFDVVPGSTNLSKTVEDEFASIEAGFDEIGTTVDDMNDDLLAALALKANIASPTFTGTPRAPTPASVGDDSTQIATTAFVQDVLGAAGALLPPQAGHSGKVLTTDGSVASWELSSAQWPSTLEGFGITNAQHALEVRRENALVTIAPLSLDFRGMDVARHGDGIVVAARIQHHLLLAQGII